MRFKFDWGFGLGIGRDHYYLDKPWAAFVAFGPWIVIVRFYP